MIFRSLMLLLFFEIDADSEEAGVEEADSEEAGVVIFHPLLPPPGSQSGKASHSTKAVTVQTKSPWETRNEK